MFFPKRRHFMLLEMLIALLLTMFLLSLLMSIYLHISNINTELEKEQDQSFKKLYLSTRLATIIPRTISSRNNEKDFFFFSALASDGLTKSGTQTLTFTFDNGVKLNPDFANHVIGRLYVNTNNQLCLAIWPSPTRVKENTMPPMKHEVLFENVQDLSFEFFLPPKRDRKMILSKNRNVIKETDFLKTESLGEWKKEWLQEYGELPPLVKLILKYKDNKNGLQTTTFLYPLPLSHFIIVYE